MSRKLAAKAVTALAVFAAGRVAWAVWRSRHVLSRAARASWEAYRNFPVPEDGGPLDDWEEDAVDDAEEAAADAEATRAVAGLEAIAEERARRTGK